MNIVIANQKGGVGKSTTCVLLANYLTLEKGQEVVIFDMDPQETVYAKWERDRELYANESLYEVIKLEMAAYPKYAADLNALKKNMHVLIDMPGRLDEDPILTILKEADLIICPIAYERSVFESSHVFARVARHLNPHHHIVFLPTRMNKIIKYEIKERVRQALSALGQIAPEIAERVALQRIDTVSISTEAREVVQETFDFIFDTYLDSK